MATSWRLMGQGRVRVGWNPRMGSPAWELTKLASVLEDRLQVPVALFDAEGLMAPWAVGRPGLLQTAGDIGLALACGLEHVGADSDARLVPLLSTSSAPSPRSTSGHSSGQPSAHVASGTMMRQHDSSETPSGASWTWIGRRLRQAPPTRSGTRASSHHRASDTARPGSDLAMKFADRMDLTATVSRSRQSSGRCSAMAVK